MDNEYEYLEHEEWRLTLTHTFIDHIGKKHTLDTPISISMMQQMGMFNIYPDICDRLLKEMGTCLKKKVEQKYGL